MRVRLLPAKTQQSSNYVLNFEKNTYRPKAAQSFGGKTDKRQGYSFVFISTKGQLHISKDPIEIIGLRLAYVVPKAAINSQNISMQYQRIHYSTKRFKSITFGQPVSQDESKSVKGCDAAVIKQPLPVPIRFPKASTEVAFHVVFDDKDPWPTELFRAELHAELEASEAFGDIKNAVCKKFEIRRGQALAEPSRVYIQPEQQ